MRPFYIVDGNADRCRHYGKQYGGTSKKFKMNLPLDPVIPLLGIYMREPRSLIGKNISTPMFIATLFNYGTLHNGILISNKKEDNFALWDSMDQPGEHYAN